MVLAYDLKVFYRDYQTCDCWCRVFKKESVFEIMASSKVEEAGRATSIRDYSPQLTDEVE